MLNHATKWDAAPDWNTATFSAQGVTIRSIDLPDQALVSGDLAAFGQAAGIDPNGAGALGAVQGERYTLRLARDRLLVVGALPDALHEGWNEAGFALTPIGGADHTFEIAGEGLPALISRAMTIDPANPGPSASVGFAAVPAYVCHHQPSGALRVHVERGLAAYVWTWLHKILQE